MKFHIHKWVEVKAFEQSYHRDDNPRIITSIKHCATGFECEKCHVRRVERVSDFQKSGSINPVRWQGILDWKNQKPTQAKILELVKRIEK